ncbi:hypothetical protein A2164_02490 [Candidatus Curtissbacteria bacterium RBG_13_35_7]|uniref:PDZ domain-containing protein n=1 Tax=Candidatus Curtissbacteria bacterium RBG_13_35_7 TaxID=1797705 RepID=A0A1F5G305_9BACT|nr:MAG: hypothetical protein A2164_02490 [Candidatus Curtissbacteria bacterium RBG_13_35_7]
MAILIFIIILSVLVLIHEFGHFIVAKRNGIGVEEFGLGLPPRAWGKKVGETIYSINWLPFGGFVKLVGEDPTDIKREQENSFYIKKVGQRAQVIVAGVFMNLILGVVIFYIVLFAMGFKFSLLKLSDHKFKFVEQSTQVLVASINENSPAQKTGIEAGELIISIDGQAIDSIDKLQQVIRANEGKPLEIVLEDSVNNSTRTVISVPEFNEELGAPALGIGLGETVALNYKTLNQKFLSGFTHSYNMVDYSIGIFGKLIGAAISEKDISAVSDNVSGPIGIAAITSQVVSFGAISILQFVGVLSLNLAIVNILPFPALDGGRFAFIIYEAVTKRRVHAGFEKWINTIGFAILIGLILLVTYSDILKLIK